MKEKAKKKSVKTKHKQENSIYACPNCPKKFNNASNWHSHIKLHSTEEPYHCELCDYKCKVKKYLSRHVKKVHTKPTGHKCPICGKCFHFNSGLRNHMRVHTGEKPYKCGACDKAFSSLFSLNGHKMIHTGEKPYQCQYCDYACRDNSTIRRHVERHLGVSKDYPCSMCNKNFKKKETLKLHVDEVHFELDTRKYPCELCDKVFKTKGTRNFHINTVHEKNNRVKCEICERITSKNNLLAHMRRHIDLKPYKCSYKPCGRRFADKGDLKRHLTIHYPENQYVCTVCNRRYSRKFRLNRHMKNGCRRAQCHYCGQLFSTKFFVAQHIKNAHGPYPKSREYICDVCEMVTYSRRGIIQHLKYGHGTEKDTKCQICKKDFFKYVTLKEHYLSHHNINYCLREKKNRCNVVVKVEPLEEVEEIVDCSDFIYEVPIEKQENIDDIPPEQLLKPTSPERLTIDSDTITYSKKVLSEDISLCLLEREKDGDMIDDFFIGHAMQKQETKFKPLKQIVDEKKKERVEKRLGELLNIARIRNQSVILEKLRKQYNRRIKMATGGGDKKEPKQNIRYFKNPDIKKSAKPGNDVDDKEINIEEDNNTINQDSNENQQNTLSAKRNSKNIDQNDEIGEDIQNNDKINEIMDENQTNDEENDDEPIDDPKDVDYKESDSDGETNPNGKLTFNTHQCYICFKLFKTKADLKLHCRDHFEVCNDKMLKKCPFCGYVTNLTITKHIKDVHNIFYDIRKNGRIKEKNTENGPKYVFQIDKDCDLEIIPSISNLNKIASMKIDEKKRQSHNLFLGTTKLVRKGGDWMVQKQKVDISNEYLLPEFSDYEYQTLKSIGDTYLERIRTLSILAKKKGIKILYPCEDCDKICLTMSALKLHSRKHEANPKSFKPKVWKNKIVNGFNGRYTHVNKKSNRKKKQANVTQNNNAVSNQKMNKKPRRLERIVKNDTAPIANRFADPNPVKNKHKCDRELIEFYKKNIKGGDIEFWQFLKIFNKMSRENVNDFKDLENRFDFGMHNIKTDSSLAKDNTESIEPTDSIKEVGRNDSVKTKPKKTKVLRNSKAFTRAIMISKKEYLRRLAIKNQMRERFKGTPT